MQSPDRGKAKALRIRLDYYQQNSSITRSRRLLIWLGVVASLVYGAWILWPAGSGHRPSGRLHVSRGPLARVHATFENDCEQCHAHGLSVALGKHSVQFQPDRRLDHQESSCQNCHRVEGHWRESLRDASQDRDCANCHHEHTGRETELARVTNSACVECHRNLQEVCRDGALSTAALSTTDFSPSTHGVKTESGEFQFRSLLVDNGRIKFDHAQHLRPGQVDPGRRGGMRLDMLPAPMRERLRMPGQNDSELVILQCASCHELGAPKGRRQHVVSDEEGRYYAPVNFEAHCQSCHQMTFPGQTGQMLPLPHVTSLAEYELLLSTRQAAFEVQSRAEMSRDEINAAAETTPSEKTREPQVSNSLSFKLDSLLQRCQQCHFPEDVTPSALELALSGQMEPLIPSRWLINGYFDHATHSRIENCQFCHEIPDRHRSPESTIRSTDLTTSGSSATEKASPIQDAAETPPTDHKHVFIRGPESCVICHRPGQAEQPAVLDSPEKIQLLLGQSHQPTWASDDCTLCHRYHWTRVDGTASHTEPQK